MKISRMPAWLHLDSLDVTLCSYKFNELELRKRTGKGENSDVLTYLNVRNYGYANMKAIGSLFRPGFHSSDDCQCKEEAKEGR